MSNKPPILTGNNLFKVVLVVAAIFFLWQWRCNSGSDEIVKIDTVWKQVKRETVYVPKPDTIIYEKTKINTKTILAFDTLYVTEEKIIAQKVDTAAILKDYNAKVVYKDTIGIKDAKGNSYGNVYLNDTITKNRISSRSFIYDLKFPEVTKTVVKQRTIFSIGLTGNQNTGTKYMSIGFGGKLNFKNRFEIEGHWLVDVAGNQERGGTVYFPIHLNRKK